MAKTKKIVTRSSRRLGRGHGSGRGKTGGRGTKGQKARGKVRFGFEGGQLPLLKRLPYKRGRNRNRSISKKPIVINVKVLNLLSEGEVTLESLIKYHIVDEVGARAVGVKILGDGQLSKAFTVSLPVSKNARAKIEKAGGKVISLEKKKLEVGKEKTEKKVARPKVAKKVSKKS